MSIERLPPQNIEAEQAVLGSLLIDREAIIRVAPFLRAEDFSRESHAQIYQAVVDLFERREPADFVTLCATLESRGVLDAVGGPAYVTSLINAVPTSIHVEHYGHIVEAAALRRRLIDAAGQIARLAYEEDRDLEEVIDRSEAVLFGVTERRQSKDLVRLRQLVNRYYDRIEYLQQHRDEMVGLPTGFFDLDKLLGGFQPSDLVIIAGRPGMGKTSLGLTVAQNAALRHKAVVAFFTLEMSGEQLVQRLIASETGIDSRRLMVADIHDLEWDRFLKASGDLSETLIFVDDTPSPTPLEIRSKCRRLAAEYDLDLVVIDYLQLMSGGTRSENRQQEISYISRSLKGLARELHTPVLALSQLSRAVEARQDKRPILSDLRESGCLAGDSLVYLPDKGTYRRIDELVGESGFDVLALDTATWKLEPRPVLRAFSTGSKPVHKLTTRLGRRIRATGNHRFLTIEGWRRLDELRAGARLALPRRLPGPTESAMSRDELALLGHLIGDGCTLPRQPIHYTTSDLALAETVAELASNVFGNAIAPRINREQKWYQVYLAAAYQLTHNVHNPIAAWLDRIGAFGLRSFEKRVPECVFAQPAMAVAHFLRHLWATDGCIHHNMGSRYYPSIYYATSSPQLARDVQSLLLRLGINADISSHSQSGRGRDQYHVGVSGKHDMEGFLDQVGALGESKLQHQRAIREHVRARSANTNRDIVPREVWRTVAVPAMQAAGLSTRATQAALGNASCGTALYKQNLSRERAARLARVVSSDRLERLARSDVYWDEVISLEADGEEEVYDLTVSGLHNFVANDVIVHNSIEQDADVVLFIYRDEVYDELTDRRNIADIIVAKHRNGPTGQVALRFAKEQTKFMDLDVYHSDAL